MKRLFGIIVTILALVMLPVSAQQVTDFLTPYSIDCQWTIMSIDYDCSGAWAGNNYPIENSLVVINGAETSDSWGGFDLGWNQVENYFGKDEDALSPFTSVDYGPVGTLNLRDRYTGMFVLFLKSSNAFSAYKIDAVNMSTIEFSTAGVSQNGVPIEYGIGQDLSHASVWFEGTTTVVPEPMTIMLVGSGLAGVAWIRRRKLFNSSV